MQFRNLIFIASLLSSTQAWSIPTADQLCQKIEERDLKSIERLLIDGANLNSPCPPMITFRCGNQILTRDNSQRLTPMNLASDNIGKPSPCRNPKMDSNSEDLKILSLLMKYKPEHPPTDDDFSFELKQSPEGLKLAVELEEEP